MFDFFGFEKLIGNARAQLDKQAGAINTKRAEVKRLRTAPLQREDVIAHLASVIDRRAGDYSAALQFSIDRLNGDPLHIENTMVTGVLSAAPMLHQTSFESMEAAILALLREDIKEALRKRIESMPWATDVGPRIADRPALIEKAERELAALEKDAAAMREKIQQAGIII